jgi:pimeloyl-ACP methyl ester carboxylesterase
VSPPNADAMRSSLPNLRSFTLLEGVGHWPQLEASGLTTRTLLEFLKSL